VSWFQRKAKKPAGMYNASSRNYACVNCAYYGLELGGVCRLHHKTLSNPAKQKCGDFLRSDCSIPEWNEAQP
jgi:hypothetical protein